MELEATRRRAPAPHTVVVAAALLTLALTALGAGSDPAARRPGAMARRAGTEETTVVTVRPVAPATPAVLPLASGALGEELAQWVAHRPRAAVSVAVADTAGRRWAGSAASGRSPLPVEEPYGILSITKTFTMALVLREAEAGRIDLDAPMPALPGVPRVEGPPITPRMLLAHVSGLVTYTEAPGYDPTAPLSPARAVALALEAPRVGPPGQVVHYTNSGYHWLGLLLEHVSGRPFEELVGGLAAELGLWSTRVDVPPRPGWVGFASGGISSTVEDVAAWGAALVTPDRVLPAHRVQEATTVGPLGTALAFWPTCPCRTLDDGTSAADGLGQPVANGGIFYEPASGMVLIVRNEGGGDVLALVTALADVADGRATAGEGPGGGLGGGHGGGEGEGSDVELPAVADLVGGQP